MENVRPVAKAKKKRKRYHRPPVQATLRFTPYAWAKLLYLRDCGDTEVGGFGISSLEDPLLVKDIRLVRQQCTEVTVQFDDESVADFFDQQVDEGRKPEQFGRIWIHTHPGISADPSGIDEETFARSFGRADWALMFILARGGETYARLRFNVGPGGSKKIPVSVDFRATFLQANHDAWQKEYERHVVVDGGFTLDIMERRANPSEVESEDDELSYLDAWHDYISSDVRETQGGFR